MRAYRTVLEQKIRERRQTFEEFAASAETFAREHNEPGTISVRHLQRLAAGRRSDGRPLGPVQPATARLLEHIFGTNIDELLASPTAQEHADDPTVELHQMLHAASQVNDATIATLNDQLSSIRRLDRQLGAVVAHDEALTKIDQVTRLLTHSLSSNVRERLAAFLSELHCLAGWQTLDLGKVNRSWQHYELANAAALQSGGPSFAALAIAGRAFVLDDIGETAIAVDTLAAIRRATDRKTSKLVRSWLAAAHGETLAANGNRGQSLRAFDDAAALLPIDDGADQDEPYVALNPVHLARWRGYALAKFADPDAVDVLETSLRELDPTFVRAETALRIDITTTLVAFNENSEARKQAAHAVRLATQIGSVRQQRRIRRLVAIIT